MSDTNSEMRKGYLAGWKRREKAEENHVTDYWFSFKPESAAVWGTRQEAESDCTAIFNRFGVDIVTADGMPYVCRNFMVEERSPGEFLVYCEAPFRVG